jgi:Zn finger protein HypA/HybF involved in hydrogenase expression
MEKVLAVIFSFIAFFVGLAFLITRHWGLGLLLVAVSLLLPFMAFRKKEMVIVEQKIDIGGEVNSRILKCKNCGAELNKEALEIKLGAVFIACPYCHSQYQIEEEPKW